MKKILSLFIICFFYNSIAAQQHNYLLHTDANISRLKEQIKKNPEVQKAWGNQLQKAKDLLKKEQSGTPDLQELGLAYRMTNDKRFAERIKKTLLNAIEQKSWEGKELLQRTPAWKGGLGTAHNSFYMAIGFDCAYNYLSPSERKQIAEGIVKLGIKPAMDDWLNPESNIHTFDTMGHNWWSACVDMAGFASLAIIDEIPEAKKWANEISATATEWINYSGNVLENKPMTFGRDGGFYESINYANFGFSQYLLFRYAFQNVLPEVKQPEISILEKMADFFIHTTYYTNEGPLSVNFGDGSTKRNGNACVLLLWNLGLQNNKYAWYLQKTMKGSDKEGMELDSPQGLLLNPDLTNYTDIKSPDLTESKLFSDLGWATLRNSWKDNASMLGIKSGFTWNHAHADAGSFILFHKGKYLIIDSGNSSYGRPEYTEYYCQSEAHNVALFNGKAQSKKDPYFGVKNEGQLYNLLETDKMKYIFSDATGPTSQWFSRNFRHFLWVGDVILVLDDLESYTPGKFEWLLHYNGISKRNGLDLSIKQDNAEVLVRPLYPETFPDGGLPHDFPEKMRLEEKTGLKDHEPDVKQSYWSISHFEETNRTKFISAITLKNDDNKDKLPVIEKFEGKDFLGVRITQNGETTEIYLNLLADGRIKHRNSLNVMNSWDTDAYLMALTFPEGADSSNPKNIKRLFLSDGSYLRKEGKPLIHALSKFSTIVDFDAKTPSLQFQGQDGATISLASKNINAVIVNGKKLDVNYNSETKLSKFVIKK
ncbi:heparinase II/III domain-containing protein [Flavobacterium undicola]|uniref:heparinase II/III domain-containing protein n=1 Tax=Flavobacterium undicola TaxID=1932779 RepID=UPI001377AAD0|nr:heparinase II/III family protein [Flavobacterium undicola]MBA0884951.1 heparinase II/III family protein [Flavobacterium undicola]